MRFRSALFRTLTPVFLAVACSAPTAADGPALGNANDGTGATSSAVTSTSVTGAISALAGDCPTKSFTLEKKTIKTSAATNYGAYKCTQLANGARVTVAGSAQGDVVTATDISFTSTIGTTPTSTPVPAISGNITALSGTCPVRTITVGDKSATTNSATFFDGKGCGDLKVGGLVNIFGTGVVGSTTFVVDKVGSPQ